MNFDAPEYLAYFKRVATDPSDVVQLESLVGALAKRDPFLFATAFRWGQTPQGYHYWCSRFRREMQMSQHDWHFLALVLRHRRFLNTNVTNKQFEESLWV
jgi:hypothetical protein